MDFSIIIGIISIIASISSVILSVTNFISTKKEMQVKIKLANLEIKLDKRDIDNLNNFINISLREECKNIENYFKKFSPHNEIKVCIYKIIDNECIKIISSSSQSKDNKKYIIGENVEFSHAKKTKEPFIINNISYFLKHGNKFLSSNTNWNKYYQSSICCPIKNENDIIIGFLSVETMKPLNDLIYKKNITDFLVQQCKIISTNTEFVKYDF